jgi:hypothetical protein
MRVWLFDAEAGQAVEAELTPMTDAHVAALNATWVPEFHRRQGFSEKNQETRTADAAFKPPNQPAPRVTMPYVTPSNPNGPIMNHRILAGEPPIRLSQDQSS